jgi:energy-coupling factor transporter ATP-binding protein EcfA2
MPMPEVTFNLHTLGWHSFQQLCHSILRENLGQTVQSFLDEHDGGRDGAFSGVWNPTGTEDLRGRFVVQCKFTKFAGKNLQLSEMSDDMDKARRLVKQGLCDVYVLLTNAGESGTTDELIVEKLRDAGVKQVRIFHGPWIERQILESKNLRSMVPRVYGLGDLSEILDDRAYKQAAAVLESMRDDLAKVVVTESYRLAAKALDAHGFVLLIGEPAAGKTTVASLLAMASADKWGARVVKASSAKEMVARWNPLESSQFFWVDDAFGVTQHESDLVSGWNHVLPEMHAMIQRGSKIVMTSRDYIYKQARQKLKESAFPLFQESQTVVNVHDLTAEERAQILYNHLKLGRQPQDFREKIEDFLDGVASHQRFIPEIARRLSHPKLIEGLHLSARSLDRFVEKREEFLIEVCERLDADSRAALALVYMRRSKLLSPIELTGPETEAVERHGSDFGGCSSALEILNGSFLIHSTIEGEAFWSFKHPTIGDAYAAIMRKNPELLGIYVQGADVDKLMWDVTCGDVQVERAVILPKNLFSLMIERLLSFRRSTSFKSDYLSSWDAQRKIRRFLADRCSKEFLEAYLIADPDAIEGLDHPDEFLEYSADVDLAIRMAAFGILPENNRASVVSFAVSCALTGGDPRILTEPGLRSLMTPAESSRLAHGIRTQLLPQIEVFRAAREDEYKEEAWSPEWHMRQFDQTLTGIAEHFPTSRRIHNVVRAQRKRARSWVELREQQAVKPADVSHDIAAKESTVAAPRGTRSIFDDIAD